MDAGQILAETLAGTGGGWALVRVLGDLLPARLRPPVAFALGFGLAVLVGILVGADWRAALAQAIGAAFGPVTVDQGLKYAPIPSTVRDTLRG